MFLFVSYLAMYRQGMVPMHGVFFLLLYHGLYLIDHLRPDGGHVQVFLYVKGPVECWVDGLWRLC